MPERKRVWSKKKGIGSAQPDGKKSRRKQYRPSNAKRRRDERGIELGRLAEKEKKPLGRLDGESKGVGPWREKGGVEMGRGEFWEPPPCAP